MALRVKMPASCTGNGFQFQLCLGLQHQSSTYPGGGTDGSSDCTLPPAQQTWTVSSPGPLSPNHCRHLGAGDELMHGSSNNNNNKHFSTGLRNSRRCFSNYLKGSSGKLFKKYL